MTIRESYARSGGNYDDVIQRFGSGNMLLRFMVKFLEEPR